MSDKSRPLATNICYVLTPVQINRAHRFALALQRVIALQEYNPMGGSRDG